MKVIKVTFRVVGGLQPASSGRPELSTGQNGTVSFSFPSEMEVGSRS